jgi:hypothetical protein
MQWRVVYGETRPAWEKIFEGRRKAERFAAGQRRVGDRIFSIKKVVPGEPPQSMMQAILEEQLKNYSGPYKTLEDAVEGIKLLSGTGYTAIAWPLAADRWYINDGIDGETGKRWKHIPEGAQRIRIR